MNGAGAQHPHVEFRKQRLEGFRRNAQGTRVAAESRHDDAAMIGNEATAADAAPPLGNRRGGMQVRVSMVTGRPISATGASRLRAMSMASALSGET